jgi:hypothetical protein
MPKPSNAIGKTIMQMIIFKKNKPISLLLDRNFQATEINSNKGKN